MNHRSAFTNRIAFHSDTDPCAKKQDTFRPLHQSLGDTKSKHGRETDDPHDDIGRLMSAAFFSTDIDPDKIKKAISTKPKAQTKSVDKRIAAIAIALVFLMLFIDLIVQRI